MENQNRPLVSIVIPVYKAEDYIGKCIESLQQQTYSNLQIILIEDGSPDSSGVFVMTMLLRMIELLLYIINRIWGLVRPVMMD